MKILKILVSGPIALILLTYVLLYESDIPKDVIDARYSSPASQFLDLADAGRIHYRDEGNRRNPAVFLLHGSNASLHTWEPWIARFGERYRVISLDFPGHGLTGETPDEDYGAKAFINVVQEVANHLELDTFVLVGNSMGGSIAWRYAATHPDRVRGLVLIASGGHPDWRAAAQAHAKNDNRDGVLAFTLLRQAWFRAIAVNLDPWYFTAQGVRSAYNNADMITDDLIMRYYDLNMRAGTRVATMKRFGISGEQNVPDLASIAAPTLIMWGEEDALTPFSNAKRFEESINNTSTAYYTDVGHIPMEEIADQSANDFVEFMNSLAEENRWDPTEP